jgi:predicted DNA-binding protein (MmcQ/YjbR family)
MFAITSLGPEGVRLSVKTTPEKFFELAEVPGVIPAPYMARNHWVALERWDAIRRSEMEALIQESYDLVLAKLPKKTQAQLAAKLTPKTANKRKKTAKES